MVTRLTGLASGMDTDTTIKQLMRFERAPLDKLKQKKQTLEWTRDQYRDMNKNLKEFDTLLFDGVLRKSTFDKKKVTSSNEAAVTAVGSGAIGNFTSTIEVSELAEAKTWVSNPVKTDTGTNVDSAAKLKDVVFNSTNQYTSAFKLTFNVQKPGEAMGTSNVELDIDPATDTLDTIATKLTQSTLGVNAFYDKTTGKFVLSNNSTGAGAELKLANAQTEGFFADLGFTTTNVAGNQVLRGTAESKDGRNSEYKINGVSLQNASNSVTVSGVTYSLKQKTTSPVNISLATDTDAIFNSVKTFVDKYNELISKVNGKVNEEKYRSYQPLTDEQRESLSEDQIKKWEEKAQSGLLRNDGTLRAAMSAIRLDINQKVENSTMTEGFKQLDELGIVTSPNYSENGKLYIQDPEKLKQKIAENPSAIYQMFASTSKDNITSEKGIGQRVRDSLKAAMDTITNKAGNALKTNKSFVIGRSLDQVTSSITNYERRVTAAEDRYYKQFAAMEKAVQKANQQGQYLASKLGL